MSFYPEFMPKQTGYDIRNGGGPKSHIPAHAATTTVAPFRAWRGSQFSVAGGPKGPP